MRSARKLLQELDHGLFGKHWLLVVGYPQFTVLLFGYIPNRKHFLQQMLDTGGEPVALVGYRDEADGTMEFDFSLTEQYENEQWATEYVVAVVHDISLAYNGRMLPPAIEKAAFFTVEPQFGMDDFSESKRQDRSQTWARKHNQVIPKFLRTRRIEGDAMESPQGGTGVATATQRAVDDLIDELRLAAQNNHAAFLIIGFEETTRVIEHVDDDGYNLDQLLSDDLDDGGDAIGIVTVTCEKVNGENCYRADGTLLIEHAGQSWARRYLDAVANSFTKSNPPAVMIGTKEFLEAS